VVQPNHQGPDQEKAKAPLPLQSGPSQRRSKSRVQADLQASEVGGQKGSLPVRSFDCPVVQTPTQTALQLHQQPESMSRLDQKPDGL